MECICSWCQKGHLVNEDILAGIDEEFICADCLLPVITNEEDAKEGSGKRRAKRYPFITLMYMATKGEPQNINKVIILNYSDSGIRMRSEVDVVTGEQVNLRIFGKANDYRILGEIVYSKKIVEPFFDIGIKLIEREHIKKYQ